MKRILIICCFFGVLACESTGVVGGEQKEFTTDAPPADSTTVYLCLTDEQSLLMEKYFEPVLLDRIDEYVHAYNSIETAQDFEKNYRDGKALFNELYDALGTPKTSYLQELAAKEEYWDPIAILDELQQMNGLIGPVEISCAAECTDLDFYFDLAKMAEKAKVSADKADDDFMALVIFIEGSEYGYAGYPGFKTWYVQTWDYGGYSMLGNGVFSEAVERVMKFEKNHALFQDEMVLFRRDFVQSLVWELTYGLSRDKVLNEFDDLLGSGYFTDEEKAEIKTVYEKIKSGDETLQFDCETGDCVYG